MKHIIHDEKVIYPFVIRKIELKPQNDLEEKLIKSLENEKVQAYLSHHFDIVELINEETPFITIKCLAKNIGLGS
jgi:hypothetical protein